MSKSPDPPTRGPDKRSAIRGTVASGRAQPSPLRVLLVEPDEASAGPITRHFIEQGASVLRVTDGAAALRAIREGPVDLAIIAAELGAPDGVELCRSVREHEDLPLIVISGRNAEEDRIEVFDAGADDLVMRPIAVRELLARVSAFVRRVRGQVVSLRRPIVVDDVVLEPGALRATRMGRDLGLTSYEFNILYALADRRGRVCSREHLIEAAGGVAEGAFERSIDVHVSRVRQKLGDDARHPQILKTVRGSGYLFARPAGEE